MYIVIRTTTGEHVDKCKTQALADAVVALQLEQDAALVKAGWIEQPATYTVVKR